MSMSEQTGSATDIETDLDKGGVESDAENVVATNSQVTDEQLINWIKSRRSIGNLTIPAPTP